MSRFGGGQRASVALLPGGQVASAQLPAASADAVFDSATAVVLSVLDHRVVVRELGGV